MITIEKTDKLLLEAIDSIMKNEMLYEFYGHKTPTIADVLHKIKRVSSLECGNQSINEVRKLLEESTNNSIKPRCAYLTIYDYVAHEKDIREKVIYATRVYITNDENIGIDTDYDEHLTIDDITPDSIYLLLQELRDQPKK